MKLFSISLCLLASFYFYQHQHACTSFTPENDVYIPINAAINSGVQEADVRKIADTLYDLYSDEFTQLKRALSFNIQWSEAKFNAYTTLFRGRAQIYVTGGMIRHPLITKDGIALVLCHEIGHHLAGKPKHKRYFTDSWASAEGQSDYFSTLKCLRRYFLETGATQVDTTKLPSSVVQACDASFSDQTMQNICKTSMVASEVMAKVLNSLKKTPRPDLGFENPDSTVVSKVFLKHPNPQCRLDTYYAGGVCTVPHNEKIDIKQDGVAQCTRKKSFSKGLRPLCWYK